MTDNVGINGLRFMACHGVLDEEHTQVQPFIVDIDVEIDTRTAGVSDNVSDTISYADLASDARAVVVDGERVDLIETLAEKIATRVLTRDPRSVTVTIHKPQAPIDEDFTDAYVRIRRENPLAQTPHEPVRAVIAFGGNLGEVDETFTHALRDIGAHDDIELVAVAPTIRTTPMLAPGQASQPDYTNTVALVNTRLSPLALLDVMQGIENRYGRVRHERWGARTLDLDLIDYNGIQAEHTRLTLPHPRAAERLFVLEPWLAIEPKAQLAGVPLTQLVREAHTTESER